jgi:hypothetical protein
MSPLVPAWIIGAPFIGLLILSFAFKGTSAMGGSAPRLPPRGSDELKDPSAPLLDPMYPQAPRRHV